MNSTANKLNSKELWKLALAQLEVKIDSTVNFKTWLADTCLLELTSEKAIIGTKNVYAAEWIQKKYHQHIKDTVRYITGDDIKVEYQVSSDLANLDGVATVKVNPERQVPNPSLLELSNGIAADMQTALTRSGINLKYNFESFVVGESNRMAHAAAIAVAENPGQVYNPYFVYGPSGLGKTHLANAIARRIIEKGQSKKIVYVSAEGFMNEMVAAIRSGKNAKFREKYREQIDLLIIDDIQFISEWDKTKVELFNTINSLQTAGKQIIIISDRTPDELENPPARLLSRFQGGIVVDVGRPDYELRLAILDRKAKSLGATIEDEFLQLIAKHITDNIRELEGALQKLILLKNISVNHPLTLDDLARNLGKDPFSKRKKITVPQILKTVAAEFDINSKEIKGSRRTAEIAMARQVCMYILRNEFNYKLEEIARLLNRKDHTTVMHGIDKVASLRMSDESFRKQLLKIIDNLEN